MVRITLVLLFACLLNSCFVARALNYPFRGQEIITSFSIDPNTSEVQTFEFDEIKTDKIFYAGMKPSMFRTEMPDNPEEYRKGQYLTSLCVDDSIVHYSYELEGYIRNGVKVLVTLSVDGVEHPYKHVMDLSSSGFPCDKSNGWVIAYFSFPGDFDINQKRKFLLSFQIIEDNKKYLSSLTNPRLVFSAGDGSVK